MHCAKFGWNWLSGSGEDFIEDVNLLSIFSNYLPLGKDLALHLKKKIESSLPNDGSSQVLLKFIFASQGFLIRTASQNNPWPSELSKSRVCLRHVM